MSALPFYLTPAGRAKLVNAQNTGTNGFEITHVGVSSSGTGVAGGALVGEIKRLTTFAGEAVADDTIHITIRDDSDSVYPLRAFALYADDGTLIGGYWQAGVIMEKSAQAMLLLSTDIQFLDLNITNVTFGDSNWLNPPATTERMGVLELATNGETDAGTDAQRGVTPAGLKYALDTRFGAGAPTAFVKTLLNLASAALFRTALELGTAATRNMGAGNGLDADLLDGQQGAYYRDYANLTNKPPTFPPSAHGHAWGDLSGVPAFASRWPTYAEVTDKPASYPPSAHTHAAGDITSGTFADARIPALAISKTTGLQTALDGKSPVAHTHDWAAIDNKPGTYPPSAHSHAIAEIVGLIAALAAKADAAHTHAAGDITSGTLAAERIPALPISLITNLQTILDAVVRKDANQNTIPASMTDWRLAAGTAEGNDILQLRLQSGGAFSTARGAILELNGANAASNGGGWRLLGAAGSQSVISGGAGSTVTFQTATYNFTSALQVNSFPVWHAGTFTPTNIPTQTGDLLVSKASSIIGIGVSGGRNGGMCNFANDGIGDVGLFSEYADGRLRMRPNGRLSATGELSVSITGATWNGNAMWHAGNFDPASKANSAHTHAAGDVTSGTFAAARISVASVTQHQSALSIGWTQVFDAGTLGEWRTISPSTKISVNGSFADAAGTNPEYKAGNSSFDCNDMPVGTRALVSQVGNLNLPPAVAGVSFWYVECRNSYTGATTRQQTAWAYNGSAAELCTRHLQGGTWSAWARSWSSANFDPNSKAPVNNPVFTGVVTAPVFDQGSARRLKKDIEDLHPDDALADIMAVAFKTYALRSDGSLQRGVIADDLLDGPLGFAVRLNEHGQPEAVNYQVLFVTACAALQCLTERVAVLEKRSRHG